MYHHIRGGVRMQSHGGGGARMDNQRGGGGSPAGLGGRGSMRQVELD